MNLIYACILGFQIYPPLCSGSASLERYAGSTKANGSSPGLRNSLGVTSNSTQLKWQNNVPRPGFLSYLGLKRALLGTLRRSKSPFRLLYPSSTGKQRNPHPLRQWSHWDSEFTLLAWLVIWCVLNGRILIHECLPQLDFVYPEIFFHT
jgi:hypothetical protein